MSESASSIKYLAPLLFSIVHISVFLTELLAFNIWTFPFNSQMKPSKCAQGGDESLREQRETAEWCLSGFSILKSRGEGLILISAALNKTSAWVIL